MLIPSLAAPQTLGRNTRVRPHTHANDADFGDLVSPLTSRRRDLDRTSLKDFLGAAKIIPMHSEGEVGAIISTQVLDNHIHFDIGTADRL